ncbi:hypothetical protein R1flu_007533 [Riccia fluitans]|uniref:Uncharacterized protein n=1 Tax=Riccia fluitans TaxID=41844 RepID=A0ABD1Z1U8_9MARC
MEKQPGQGSNGMNKPLVRRRRKTARNGNKWCTDEGIPRFVPNLEPPSQDGLYSDKGLYEINSEGLRRERAKVEDEARLGD